MSASLHQPVPKNLREQMIKRLETAPEEDVIFVHDLMLMAEKDRLWRQIQTDAEEEAAVGKLDEIPELVRRYRARNRAQA